MARSRKIRAITPRQRQVLDYIGRQIERDGRPPTLREIAAQFHVGSTNAVRDILSALEKKGFIHRQAYLSRGIELVRPKSTSDRVVSVPIVGRVAAGEPLLAVENIEGELLVDRDMFRTDDGFALRVRGQSMVEAGIMDGDIVLARPDLPVGSGEIVVALIGDEATVKRFYREGNTIRLEPANPNFDPIILNRGDADFSIAGKVTGLYRQI